MQLDSALIDAFHHHGFEVAVETNGTLPVPEGIDWVCVSPKGKAQIVVTECDELKLVFPQTDAMPERFEHIKAGYYYLTPMADPRRKQTFESGRDPITQQTVQYCLAHPRWRLNLQTHKVIDVP